jgi:tetratricopeptide (TPR) repeat protein
MREENRTTRFGRHFAWIELGDLQRALVDLDHVIARENEPSVISCLARGQLHRELGQYGKALQDFDHAEALDPKAWDGDIVFGLYFQADVHARLGNEAASLACCNRLPNGFPDSRHSGRASRQ